MAPTTGRTARRCLHCDAFVTGGPHDSGPAAAGPLWIAASSFHAE